MKNLSKSTEENNANIMLAGAVACGQGLFNFNLGWIFSINLTI